MYAVNPKEYEKWRSVHNPAYRFWIRTWIDSLHSGTHVHWQLSPISVLGLAYLWKFMSRQEDQYIRRQRLSIRLMTLRRQTDPGQISPMPQFEDQMSSGTI